MCFTLFPHYLLCRTRQENSNCREKYSGPDGLLCSMEYRGLLDFLHLLFLLLWAVPWVEKLYASLRQWCRYQQLQIKPRQG